MILKLDSIPATGFKARLEERGESFKDVFRKSGYILTGPIGAVLDITLEKGGVYINGSITALFKVSCGRCLEDFDFKVDTPVALFLKKLSDLKGEVELNASDMDVNALAGDEIDTSEILLSQIAMELPLRALCSEDCRGLCQRCGAELNKEPCRCVAEDEVDARLAALKGFKVQ